MTKSFNKFNYLIKVHAVYIILSKHNRRKQNVFDYTFFVFI